MGRSALGLLQSFLLVHSLFDFLQTYFPHADIEAHAYDQAEAAYRRVIALQEDVTQDSVRAHLELAGRMLATGYLFGRHLGQRHGPGFEYGGLHVCNPSRRHAP